MDPIRQRILLFGSISFISYFLIFYYEEMVMHYFVLGAWHALLPIITAFLISIVYGSFSNYVIEYFNRILKERNNK